MRLSFPLKKILHCSCQHNRSIEVAGDCGGNEKSNKEEQDVNFSCLEAFYRKNIVNHSPKLL